MLTNKLCTAYIYIYLTGTERAAVQHAVACTHTHAVHAKESVWESACMCCMHTAHLNFFDRGPLHSCGLSACDIQHPRPVSVNAQLSNGDLLSRTRVESARLESYWQHSIHTSLLSQKCIHVYTHVLTHSELSQVSGGSTQFKNVPLYFPFQNSMTHNIPQLCRIGVFETVLADEIIFYTRDCLVYW